MSLNPISQRGQGRAEVGEPLGGSAAVEAARAERMWLNHRLIAALPKPTTCAVDILGIDDACGREDGNLVAWRYGAGKYRIHTWQLGQAVTILMPVASAIRAAMASSSGRSTLQRSASGVARSIE